MDICWKKSLPLDLRERGRKGKMARNYIKSGYLLPRNPPDHFYITLNFLLRFFFIVVHAEKVVK